MTHWDVGILFIYCSNSPVVKINSDIPLNDDIHVCSANFSFVWKTTYLMSALLTKFLKKLSSDSV